MSLNLPLNLPLKLHRIPGLALFSAGALLGLLLTCLIILPEVSQRLATAQKDYGQTLASLTARRVIDAFFNNDLVRLQVVLQDLDSHPHVIQATIHDVENNLLVQAGEVRPAAESNTPYAASIVIHDSISGYVTVTLQNFNQALNHIVKTLWTLAILLLIILGVSLYHARSIEWIAPVSRKKAEVNDDEDLDSESETPSTDLSEEPDDSELVYAVIHIKNHEVLKQQLTSDTFRSTFNKLENIIGDVIALYGGREFYPEDNYYILKFRAVDAMNEAIFRASCSAWLIVELASIINKVPLDLAAFVSANREDLVPAKLPVAGLVMETRAAQDELIQRRLNFMDVGTEDGRRIVANFEQPFCNLLENQRKHLTSLYSD